ncbi:MAG: hypothetical protein Q8933_17250, partial [Bacteroidota bacterium]|nr:hypothetical protein [Bacteroidota bacterium]
QNQLCDIYIYDTKKDSTINLTPGNNYEAYSPRWTPDGKKIIFSYHRMGENQCTYIMNADGSNKKKLLDFEAHIYFYKDNFRFIYQPAITFTDVDYEIHLSDLNNSGNVLLTDTRNIGGTNASVCDFNPNKNDLLVLISRRPYTADVLATYNIDTKKVDTLLLADNNYIFFMPKYSPDYSKIGIMEINYVEHKSRLSTYYNGFKNILTEQSTSDKFFDFNPFEFSANNRYIAFAVNTYPTEDKSTWLSNLYIIDTDTKRIQYIDQGKAPHWNPKLDK